MINDDPIMMSKTHKTLSVILLKRVYLTGEKELARRSTVGPHPHLLSHVSASHPVPTMASFKTDLGDAPHSALT